MQITLASIQLIIIQINMQRYTTMQMNAETMNANDTDKYTTIRMIHLTIVGSVQ